LRHGGHELLPGAHVVAGAHHEHEADLARLLLLEPLGDRGYVPEVRDAFLQDVDGTRRPLDWLFYNNFVVGSISEEEKATMRKATEILQRLYGKK